MAEPLKNSFGPEIPRLIGAMLETVASDFDTSGFVTDCLDGYEALELTDRAHQIANALADHLPADRSEALGLIVASLGSEIEGNELTGMDGFRYLPFVFFVSEHGLDHFEEAMTAQYELTKRFTSEFSIRAYLEHHPARTLDRLRTWAGDPNVHVRRLVSEGTRPRLPWAPRLRSFQADPAPVIELLELLKDDPEEYVRRSVANNLNDIAKDHPDLVVEIAERWQEGASRERLRLIRHGLRTLVKQGHPGALAVLGFGADSPVRMVATRIEPQTAHIGGKITIEVDLENPGSVRHGALVDLVVHFVKANGSLSPKVFKGSEVWLDAGTTRTIKKTVSLRQHSTRTHHPGRHEVEIQVNGVAHPGGWFDLEV